MNYFQIVTVGSQHAFAPAREQKGYVVALPDERGDCLVFLYALEEVVPASVDDLSTTGEIDEAERQACDERDSIRVRVDPVTGVGKLVPDPDRNDS